MPLVVYTARLDPHLRDPDLLDVTRAGADRALRRRQPAPGEPFAPSWMILGPAVRRRAHAERTLRGEGLRGALADLWSWYAPRYVAEMRVSYRLDRAFWGPLEVAAAAGEGKTPGRVPDRAAWEALLARPRVVLGCVCPTTPDALHCHRHLLAGILRKLGAENRGELPPQAGAQMEIPT